MKKTTIDTLPRLLFVFSLMLLSFGYGYLTVTRHWFPYYQIENAKQYTLDLVHKTQDVKPWYYQPTKQTQHVTIHRANAMQPGATLYSCVNGVKSMSVRVIAPDGSVIHKWFIDWFKVWPNATHIPEWLVPKSRPGTHIHGIVMLDNGDIVFNFTELGLVRMDVAGKVVWKLPYCTHHSVTQDSDGNLWVCGKIHHIKEPVKEYPYLRPPFQESTLLKISPDGDILQEISILDVLRKNDLTGMIVMPAKTRWDVTATGDLMHLNDVEPFPDSLQEGVFKHSDLLVSLRDIHTVLVFDPETYKIRYIKTGGMVRQHDPDFVDGNTISIYDNNNIAVEGERRYSRILLLDARKDKMTVYYRGTNDHPFFSPIMGGHEWQANGNLLLIEPIKGRAFEIDQQGNTVWEYHNLLGDGYTGVVESVTRLAPKYNREFFLQRLRDISADRQE